MSQVDYLDDFYVLRDQMKRELLFNSQHRQKRARLKKARLQEDKEKTAKFEQRFLKLKKRWKDILANIYASHRDTGVYDKIAYDFRQLFSVVCSEYMIKDDFLYFAVRCVAIPVSGSILDECKFNRSALELQKLRHYFLLKLLTIEVTDAQFPEPSRDEESSISEGEGAIDVGSQPTPQMASEPVESQHTSQQPPKPRLNYSQITNFIVEVLLEALSKTTSLITAENFDLDCYKSHVHHILNSTYLANTLVEFLDCIRDQVKHDTDHSLLNNPRAQYARDCLEKHNQLLINSRTLLLTNHRWGIFESQLHGLTNRITILKYMLRK